MSKFQLGQQFVGDITPEMAAVMLESNGLNRKQNKSKINRYAAEMADGTFDPVKLFEGKLFYIDVDGVLVSAQHRLEAAIKANYTFTNALTVVIDRNLFNEKSVEARSPREIAQMSLKGISQEITPQISDVIHAVTGQRVYLEAKKPFVSKRTVGYETDDLVEVYKEIGEDIELLFLSVPKISKVAANSLACLIFAKKITVEDAIGLGSNPDIKAIGGTGVLHWTHAFTDFINEVETQPSTEKVFLGK